MRKGNLKVFYRPEMVYTDHMSGSRSPEKPKLFMDKLAKEKFDKDLDLNTWFDPMYKEAFEYAHTKQYVNAVFEGKKPLCESSGLKWSPSLLTSVQYTTSSLYEAIKYSVLNPSKVTVSPTSGFHHAMPNKGKDFCTFAGQVVASVMLYEKLKLRGVYFDLDAHFGNSLEDCRKHNPTLNKAVPSEYNVNPEGESVDYVINFIRHMQRLSHDAVSGKIDYIVWCHGADSHIWDDMGRGVVSTEQWIECSRKFYKWIRSIDEERKKKGLWPIPLIISLFGGYRADDYDSVLSLHVKDLSLCLNILYDKSTYYRESVAVPNHVYVLTKNEKDILSYFDRNNTNDIGIGLSGMELGKVIKNWKNHSMSKWADQLVQKGLLYKHNGFYNTRTIL